MATHERKSILVLGGGMVGGFIARKLAAFGPFSVTLADRDEGALARSSAVIPMETRVADLADLSAIRALAADADLVVGAVPGALGFAAAKAVLETKRDLVDISFFPEDAFELADVAAASGKTAVVDCGVMPGFGGMLAVRMARQLDRAERGTILVGGLPVERRWPTEYKAPFSPIDVIEEYTRPARYRDHGEIVVRPALSDPELVDLPGVGTLEAFNTDGLRTLLKTLDLPSFREKTLRYPGHIHLMRALRELGFFAEEPVELRSGPVVPRDLAAKLLFAEWKLEPKQPEITVMRVEVEGSRAGRRLVLTADLLDRTDPITGDSSMARTTGWPAVVAATLLLEGRIERTGLIPAERLAEDPVLMHEILARLSAAGIRPVFSEKPVA